MDQHELKALADRLTVEARIAGCTAVVVSVAWSDPSTDDTAFHATYSGGLLEAQGLCVNACKTLERAWTDGEAYRVWTVRGGGGAGGPSTASGWSGEPGARYGAGGGGAGGGGGSADSTVSDPRDSAGTLTVHTLR